MTDTDLTARIAETAASIEQHLADDERTAKGLVVATRFVDGRPDFYGRGGPAAEAHWDRFTPGRILGRVKATRELVAEILAEPHDSGGGRLYSCSQVIDPDREPFAVARAGKPCDCGRDAKAARLLGIIAGEWRDDRI